MKHLAAVALLLVASSVQAQRDILLKSPNESSDGLFGTSVASIPDINGNGTTDIVIGAFGEMVQGVDAGRAYVYDGGSGGLLQSLTSPSPRNQGAFGIVVAQVGDVNNDRFTDVAIGAPGEFVSDNTRGRVYVFSGVDGTLVRTLDGPAGARAFGYAIAPAGDVDGDGRLDVLVGDYKRSVPGVGEVGAAYVMSTQTGQVLVAIAAPAPEANLDFGRALAAGYDLTGDGVVDWVVAARKANTSRFDAGRVYVIDGQSRQVVRSLESPRPSDGGLFGVSIDVCTGADGPVVVVGAGRESEPASEAGRAYTFDGRTGALRHALESPQPVAGGHFGQSVACLGDVDQDGTVDLAVGASGESRGAGAVYVFSGATGALLRSAASPGPQPNGGFGISVAGVGARGAAPALAAGAYRETGLARSSGLTYIQALRPAVASAPPAVRSGLTLGAPFPNPTVTSAVTLSLVLSRDVDVTAEVVDLQGRTLRRIAMGRRAAGSHPIVVQTAELAAGSYVVRVQAGDNTLARALTVGQ